MDTPKKQLFTDDEINFSEVLSVIWGGKWLISVFVTIAAVASVAASLVMNNIYTASAKLYPSEQSSGGISGLMKQYGGLASLAGISLPSSQEGTAAQLGLEILTSRAFIADFVKRRNILPELMAVDSWNISTDKIEYDADIYEVETGKWVREVDPPRASIPSNIEAHEKFLEILKVSEDSVSGYVTVSISHESPTVAARWVTWLVEDLNETVKAQEVNEASKSIEYLTEQVSNTSLRELQTVFFELIQSQTETVMLAEVRDEYVFKTLDPAVVPEEKSGPNRALICIVGTLLGALFGMIIVLINHHRGRSGAF